MNGIPGLYIWLVHEAERAFRHTRLRVATENIGLAQLADGMELVRIGKPLRSGFAAWRYSNQFAWRYRKTIALGAGSALAANFLPVFGY